MTSASPETIQPETIQPETAPGAEHPLLSLPLEWPTEWPAEWPAREDSGPPRVVVPRERPTLLGVPLPPVAVRAYHPAELQAQRDHVEALERARLHAIAQANLLAMHAVGTGHNMDDVSDAVRGISEQRDHIRAQWALTVHMHAHLLNRLDGVDPAAPRPAPGGVEWSEDAGPQGQVPDTAGPDAGIPDWLQLDLSSPDPDETEEPDAEPLRAAFDDDGHLLPDTSRGSRLPVAHPLRVHDDTRLTLQRSLRRAEALAAQMEAGALVGEFDVKLCTEAVHLCLATDGTVPKLQGREPQEPQARFSVLVSSVLSEALCTYTANWMVNRAGQGSGDAQRTIFALVVWCRAIQALREAPSDQDAAQAVQRELHKWLTKKTTVREEISDMMETLVELVPAPWGHWVCGVACTARAIVQGQGGDAPNLPKTVRVPRLANPCPTTLDPGDAPDVRRLTLGGREDAAQRLACAYRAQMLQARDPATEPAKDAPVMISGLRWVSQVWSAEQESQATALATQLRKAQY